MMEHHTCTTCGKLKPAGEYWKRKDRPKGVASSCRQCQTTKTRKDWTPRQHREYKLKTTFGLSLDDYEGMAKSQNYRCAICHKEETAKSNKGFVKCLAVDHCHETGRIRGLLCQACNTALGKFKDDEALLKSAINYLKEGL